MYQNTATRNGTLDLPAGIYGDGYTRLMKNNAVVQQGTGVGISGLGMTAQEIADLIKQTSAATLPILVAQNPGVRYETRADGSIVIYSQPTGTQATLPGGFTSQGLPYSPGAAGNVQLPGGTQASFQGVDMNTVVLVGGALIAVMLLAGRK